jgi:hypothetical protein
MEFLEVPKHVVMAAPPMTETVEISVLTTGMKK